MSDEPREIFQRGLIPWDDDDDGFFFQVIMDAYTDRLQSILEPAGFRLSLLTNDADIEIPAGTPQEVRDAITGAAILGRITQLIYHYVVGEKPEDAAVARIAFSELFLAGALFHTIDPEGLNQLRKNKAYQEAHVEGGRKSGAARKKWHRPARAAFDTYRLKNPHKTVATEIMRGMDRAGRVPRSSDKALLKLIRDWVRPERQKRS